ncbi:MAG: 50S ribosomal protein L4 [Patescibacteria group bacterium]
MKIDMYNMQGKVVGSVELDDRMFGVSVRPSLVHEAVVAQQANARVVYAHTKDRGEVRGGGKKPWKQKGTGRARHGSRRSPIWIGGGITFGPTALRNFALKINRRARRKALFMALSDKVATQAFVVVDAFSVTEPKTREVVAMLKALPLKGRRALMVVDAAKTDIRRATQNVENAQTIAPNSLNVEDVVTFGSIVIGKDELDALTKHFLIA